MKTNEKQNDNEILDSIIENLGLPVDKDFPTEDEIIDTIINYVFIRGVELENYRHEFTEERSGLISALNKLYSR